MYDFEAPLRITNNGTGTRDLILIEYENKELITEEHRILQSELSYGILTPMVRYQLTNCMNH